MQKDNTDATEQVQEKYRNFAERMQAVAYVNEPALRDDTAAVRFLFCLAVHSIGEDPHPGNARLMQATGVKTRQGINAVSDRVEAMGLAKIVDAGGGRGRAAVYRICFEDDRFPTPEMMNTRNATVAGIDKETRNATVAGLAEKPATENEKPATGHPETRNWPVQNSMKTNKVHLPNRITNRTMNRTKRKRRTLFSGVYEPVLKSVILNGRTSYFCMTPGQRNDPARLQTALEYFRKNCAPLIEFKHVDPLWRLEVKQYCDERIRRRNEAHLRYVMRWRRRHPGFDEETRNAYEKLIVRFPLFGAKGR